MTNTCACAVKVRATNVSAIVHKGYLLGLESVGPNERHKYKPIVYDVLEFCQRPTCEKVFKAEKKRGE
jgi:hypothetical protein